MSAHERERLSAYLDDELDPRERAAVETHLVACPECTGFLAELATVDEAAAALPAEAPPGYFETFPARVRARLQPRKAASPMRRVPVWTWAAAAALLLAVITPLTLRQGRPAAHEARPHEPPPAAMVVPTTPPEKTGIEAPKAQPWPQPQPTPAATVAPQARPSAPGAPRRSDQPLATPPPVTEGAPEEKRDQAAAGRFAPEPAPAQRDELGLAKQRAAADAESEGSAGGVPGGVEGGVMGGVVPQQAASREKAEGEAPRPQVAAESASPMMSAASAGHDATPAMLQAQEDAFRRLEAVRPRTPEGWRRVREQWNALAAAEADPARADEARVRAVIAAREAWRSGGDEGDAVVFRAEAETYLRRADARQKPRVARLLAEAAARPAP